MLKDKYMDKKKFNFQPSLSVLTPNIPQIKVPTEKNQILGGSRIVTCLSFQNSKECKVLHSRNTNNILKGAREGREKNPQNMGSTR